jgi:hypothetical protein
MARLTFPCVGNQGRMTITISMSPFGLCLCPNAGQGVLIKDLVAADDLPATAASLNDLKAIEGVVVMAFEVLNGGRVLPCYREDLKAILLDQAGEFIVEAIRQDEFSEAGFDGGLPDACHGNVA